MLRFAASLPAQSAPLYIAHCAPPSRSPPALPEVVRKWALAASAGAMTKLIVPPEFCVMAPSVTSRFAAPLRMSWRVEAPAAMVVPEKVCVLVAPDAPLKTIVPPFMTSDDVAARMLLVGAPAAEKSAVIVPSTTVVAPV
jgi:hypothetical protein